MSANLKPGASLHYLGNYVRQIPVSLSRMMENAYDWEHLPFVHSSSFAAIELIDQGEWGWRCKTVLPTAAGGGEQLVELRVDRAAHYWATTVLEGTGEGVQIHTHAKEIGATDKGAADGRLIEVDVRFYVPQAPETDEQGAMILTYLQAQYTMLYDEDAALMEARQDALDQRKADGGDRPAAPPTRLDLGPEAALDHAISHTVELAQGRFAVRYHQGEWIAHAAICPHMLGPLSDAVISADGLIACPWHDYQFALTSGEESQLRCGALPAPPLLRLVDGHLCIGE